MKKFFISCLFVLSGSALWWGVSNTARFSIKKWDAKFDSVLRHSFTGAGLKNEDIISSVNELKNDSNGEFVVRRVKVKKLAPAKMNEIIHELEDAGASVSVSHLNKESVLSIKRGSRTYQEISFQN